MLNDNQEQTIKTILINILPSIILVCFDNLIGYFLPNYLLFRIIAIICIVLFSIIFLIKELRREYRRIVRASIINILRTNKKRIIIALVPVLIIFIFFFLKPQISYYDNVIEVYGLPQGVGQALPRKELKSRISYWKISDSKFGKVELTYKTAYNQLDLLNEYSSSFSLAFFKQPAKIEYEYNIRGKEVKSATYFDSSNRKMMRLDYKNLEDIKVTTWNSDSQLNLLQSKMECLTNTVNMEKTSYSDIQAKYTEEGLLIQRIYSENKFKNNGFFGEYYNYNDKNQLIELAYLDSNGNRTSNIYGVSIIKFFYEEKNDKYVKVEYYDIKNNPVSGVNGSFCEQITYDENKNIGKIAFLNEKLSEGNNKNGIHLYKFDYEITKHNFNVTESYINNENVFVSNKAVKCMYLKYSYNAKEQKFVLEYIQRLDDNISEEYSSITTERKYNETDDYSLEINKEDNIYDNSSIFFDSFQDLSYSNGNTKKDEIVEYIIKKNGQIKSAIYKDKNNNLVLNKRNYAKCEYNYDKKNQLCEEIYYGISGKRVLTQDGYSRVTFKYYDDGSKKEVQYFDIDDKGAVHKEYGYSIIRFNKISETEIIETYYGLNEEPIYLSTGGYASLYIKYDAEGKKIQEAYKDMDGELIIHKITGVSICKYYYTIKGELFLTNYYGLDGKLILNNELGAAVIVNKCDNKGYIKEQSFYNKEYDFNSTDNERNLTIIKDKGYSSFRNTYDERGNITKIEYFDNNGDYTLRKDTGYAVCINKYNEKNQIIKQLYYDCNYKDNNNELDNLTYYKDWGICYIEYDYNENGNNIECRYYDNNGKLALHSEYGIAIEKVEYDNVTSDIIGKSYFDTKENPVCMKNKGYASFRSTYDKRGNCTKSEYFDTKGDYTMRYDTGYAVCINQYNEKNQMIKQLYYDCNYKDGGNELDNLAYYKDWEVCYIEYDFDENGNISEYQLYGMDGKLTLCSNYGYAILNIEYDAVTGKTLTRNYYDTEGYPVSIKDKGYSRYQEKYDKRGNWIKREYFDEEGNYTLNQDTGYAVIITQYNEKSQIIKQLYYDCNYKDGDNELDNLAYDKDSGVCYIEYEYDENGNYSEYRYYGDDGSLILRSDYGYAIIKTEIDAVTGKNLNGTYYDTEGKPISEKNVGYAGYRNIYDERGNWIKSEYFDKEGNYMLRQDTGYAVCVNRYNEKDQRIKQLYYNCNYKEGDSELDNLTYNKNYGMCYTEYEYDENGNNSEYRYYGNNGNMVLRSDYGFAIQKIECDAVTGKTFKANYYDMEGNPVRIKNQGYTGYQDTYDEKGNLLKSEYFDEEGNYTLRQDTGYAVCVNRYNEKSQRIKQLYYDCNYKESDNELDNLIYYKNRGMCYIEYEYDENGNDSEYRYYGDNGNLVLRSDYGYAIFKTEIDVVTGKNLIGSYYDTEGNPVRIKDVGYAGYRNTYDERGNWIKSEYFDKEGSNMLRQDTGYAVCVNRYNRKDQRIKQLYYDCNYKEGDNELDNLTYYKNWGMCYIEYEYDENGNNSEYRYFGDDGKLVLLSDYGYAIQKVECDTVTGKIITGNYYDVEGNPVRIKNQGYTGYRDTYDERGNLLKSEYFDKEGNYKQRQDTDYAVCVNQYNEKDQRIKQLYYDCNYKEGDNELDNLTDYKNQGMCYIEYEYDKNGNNSEYRYYGSDGKLVYRSDYGYAILKTEIDAVTGKTLAESYYNKKGKSVSRKDVGYAGYQDTYDERGNWLKSEYFDKEGNYKLRQDTDYAVCVNQYNEKDQRIKQIYYDCNYKEGDNELDNLTYYKNQGMCYIEYEYDENGNNSEYRYYGDDGKLVLRSDYGYAILKTEIDAVTGKTLTESYYNKKRKPVKRKDVGYTSYQDTYDERGNWLKSEYFDKEGNYKLRQDTGYAVCVNQYNAKDQRIKQLYYDCNYKEGDNELDNLTYYKNQGMCYVEYEYDENGNNSEYRYYGDDGKLVLRSDYGYAILKIEIDAVTGITLSESYYDTKEKPVRIKNLGFAGYLDTYDENGNWLKREYYDEGGNIVDSFNW